MDARETLMRMLKPPHPDACQTCGARHDPTLPHNRYSLWYQIKFKAEHGRMPTWADAMAHCPDTIKDPEKAQEDIRRLRACGGEQQGQS